MNDSKNLISNSEVLLEQSTKISDNNLQRQVIP